ncbi:hypothetical protein C8D92_104249 [Tamilnaduibacter salinus]|uniref:Uncharacterized protein n=1 Tax=Tamilnaduibacter salinus TaxID=1484056 RepID=A0A2U1CY20_9GAMM|nr:hypothetical protein C8D92_104249 [Tamilnaduibacter salinus]
MMRVDGTVTHAAPRALTGGAVFLNMLDNTPAMPLHDAHFGGFFVSGGRQ